MNQDPVNHRELEIKLENTLDELRKTKAKLQNYIDQELMIEEKKKQDFEMKTTKVIHLRLNPIQMAAKRANDLRDTKIRLLEEETTLLRSIVAEAIRSPMAPNSNYFHGVVKDIVRRFKTSQTVAGLSLEDIDKKLTEDPLFNPFTIDDDDINESPKPQTISDLCTTSDNNASHRLSNTNSTSDVQASTKAEWTMDHIIPLNVSSNNTSFSSHTSSNNSSNSASSTNSDASRSHPRTPLSPLSVGKENGPAEKRRRISFTDSEIYVENASLKDKIEELAQKLQEGARVTEKMKKVFGEKARQYRETVVQTLGYKVDLHPKAKAVIVRPATNYVVPYGEPRPLVTLMKQSANSLDGGYRINLNGDGQQSAENEGKLRVVEGSFVRSLPEGVTKYLAEDNPGAFFSALTFFLKQTYEVEQPEKDASDSDG